MHRISCWPDIPAFLSGYLAGRIIRPFLFSVRSEKQQALSGCLFILLWNINMQYLLWGKISCISGIRPDRKSGIDRFESSCISGKICIRCIPRFTVYEIYPFCAWVVMVECMLMLYGVSFLCNLFLHFPTTLHTTNSLKQYPCWFWTWGRVFFF